MEEYTRVHKDARFHTIPEYPQFVCKEGLPAPRYKVKD